MAHRKAPPVRHDAPGMKGQLARTEQGTLRQKRGDTQARMIEDVYHVNLGVRSDKQLLSSGTSELPRLTVSDLI